MLDRSRRRGDLADTLAERRRQQAWFERAHELAEATRQAEQALHRAEIAAGAEQPLRQRWARAERAETLRPALNAADEASRRATALAGQADEATRREAGTREAVQGQEQVRDAAIADRQLALRRQGEARDDLEHASDLDRELTVAEEAVQGATARAQTARQDAEQADRALEAARERVRETQAQVDNDAAWLADHVDDAHVSEQLAEPRVLTESARRTVQEANRTARTTEQAARDRAEATALSERRDKRLQTALAEASRLADELAELERSSPTCSHPRPSGTCGRRSEGWGGNTAPCRACSTPSTPSPAPSVAATRPARAADGSTRTCATTPRPRRPRPDCSPRSAPRARPPSGPCAPCVPSASSRSTGRT